MFYRIPLAATKLGLNKPMIWFLSLYRIRFSCNQESKMWTPKEYLDSGRIIHLFVEE